MPDERSRLSYRLRNKIHIRIEEFRHSLAYIDALPQLTLLGLASGMVAAGVIVVFRLLVDNTLLFYLNGNTDNFEQLSAWWRFSLPCFGALAIGACLHFLPKNDWSTSVSHVLDRLHNHQGQLPLRNVVVQFFGAAASLVTGQSVGREGPAVHLGAGVASVLGQWLQLPNNSLRILVGCGVAAAIAASFNTPIAGVIFAMEVVLMEYTITGFIPVILAAVSGAAVGQLVFTDSSVFAVQSIQMNSLLELPFMALAGFVIAFFAAVFSYLQAYLQGFAPRPIVLRLFIAGLLTGAVALVVPQVLGMGYDTLAAAMRGQVALQTLLALIVAKLLITSLSVGLGMPGGLIGPTLVIGGCLGGALGIGGQLLFPEQASAPQFYVVLGMAAMMGAVLNAPLAALMAVLELTYNPNIIFPSMVVIVVACFLARQVFDCEGIFVAQLKATGRSIHAEPARQLLSRVGVRGVMSTDFVVSEPQLTRAEAQQLLEDRPRWILVDITDKGKTILRAADLANQLQTSDTDTDTDTETELIDLLEMPAQRLQLAPIHQRANLYEAQQLMQQSKTDAVYVERGRPIRGSTVMGLITRDTIENYYSP